MSQSSQQPPLENPSRRNFLRVGIAGTAILATVGITTGVVSFNRMSQQPQAEGFRFLRPNDVEFFTALVPVVLGNSLPTNEDTQRIITQVVQRIDDTCSRLGSPNQKELTQLFDLVNFAPSRRLATGVKHPWPDASGEDISDFLARWRHSRVGLFNAAYRVLTKLVANAYFALPVSFAASGYPGPLAHMYNALNP